MAEIINKQGNNRQTNLVHISGGPYTSNVVECALSCKNINESVAEKN